ncbi:hypothetical protein L7F22_020257 [Adiantum nelumboides]|nr:hypothetical protein [Adiantum nelumboides]
MLDCSPSSSLQIFASDIAIEPWCKLNILPFDLHLHTGVGLIASRMKPTNLHSDHQRPHCFSQEGNEPALKSARGKERSFHAHKELLPQVANPLVGHSMLLGMQAQAQAQPLMGMTKTRQRQSRPECGTVGPNLSDVCKDFLEASTSPKSPRLLSSASTPSASWSSTVSACSR